MKAAEQRLNRAKERAEAGDSENAEEMLEEYNEKVSRALDMVEKAETMGRNVTEVQERIFAASSTHQETLQDVYERVPEEAKEAVEKAIEVSAQGREKASEALNISLPPQAERASAGKQEDGGREEITPHETPQEEREERTTETPAPTEPPVETEAPETLETPSPPETPPETPEATELPETPIETETPETPSPPETPVGQGGMP